MNRESPGTARYAAALAIVLMVGILTIWVRAYWPWAMFQLAVLALAAGWVARMMRCSLPLRGRLLLGILAGAPLLGLLQLVAGSTIYSWETWKSVLNWTTWLGVFFLATQLLARPDSRRRFLRALAVFGFALSVVAIVQTFTSGGRIYWIFPSGYTQFVMGPFVYQNQYAAFMELLLPVALYEALRDPARCVMWAAMAGVMFASVVAAASRAGVLLACAEIVLVLLVGRARQAARALGAFVGLAVLFTAMVGWEVAWKRFQRVDPFLARREMLLSSLRMIRERPGMGVGLGDWPVAYPRHALYDDGTFANQAHNDWLQWTAEGGVPFGILMLAIAIATIRPAMRSVWGIGIVSVWLHCLVDYPLQQRPALAAWFFALLGAVAAYRQERMVNSE
jgi:O-antigen ligase